MATITQDAQPRQLPPLSEAVERLAREAFTRPRSFSEAIPTHDGLTGNLYETKKSYIMQMALPPDVRVDEVEITARQNVLVVRSTMEIALPAGARRVWVGMAGDEFCEEITLPGQVDVEKASAAYHEGILTLTLPKAEHIQVKTIRVGGEA